MPTLPGISRPVPLEMRRANAADLNAVVFCEGTSVNGAFRSQMISTGALFMFCGYKMYKHSRSCHSYRSVHPCSYTSSQKWGYFPMGGAISRNKKSVSFPGKSPRHLEKGYRFCMFLLAFIVVGLLNNTECGK